jgi:hypothetical protein
MLWHISSEKKTISTEIGGSKNNFYHKGQGSTLKAAVHCGSRKNDHKHYVGLSRVTNIENLYIIHLNEK